jgi:hypothetical protein
MTQEFIANILGGRRETVTVAAGRLQDAGLIQYTRGRLRIVDRKKLEETACECYQAVKSECSRPYIALVQQQPTVLVKSRAQLV